MASSTKRVVGWFNRDEWKEVYKELFSEDFLSQKHALDKVAVWKCRSLHKLSTAVECTTELVRAEMMDLQQVELGLEPHEVRLTMAMAVIRFVNLITEKYQNRSYAQSVHNLAEELGLPEWLVDLRHDATHSSLPSMPLLQSAVAFSLGWLQERYWDVQDKEEDVEGSHSDSGSKPEPLEPDVAIQKLAVLFEEYVNIQCHVVQNVKGHKQKKEYKESRQILNKIERLAVSNREQALHCLVQDGVMVPTENQLLLYNVSLKDITESDDLHLPSQMVDVWKPCLKLFHHLLLTQQLLQLVSMSITDTDSFRNKLLAGWLILILQNAKEPETVSRSQRLYNSGCDVDSQSLVRNIVKSPNRYTNRLLHCLFDIDDCGFDDRQKEQLIACITTYTSPPCGSAETTSDNVLYTMKDLIYTNDVPDSEQMEEESSETPTWVLATDVVDWSKYPLGTCPGVKVTYTNLELFTGNQEQDPQEERLNDGINPVESSSEIEEDVMEECENVTNRESVWNKEKLKKLVDSIKLY